MGIDAVHFIFIIIMFTGQGKKSMIQLTSATFEHSVLHVREIYAFENVLLYIEVYKP